MSAQPEIWRVNTIEGVFETDFETLNQWISEGAVQPTDKVSKGSLNWIEAGRVPKLKAAFNGEPFQKDTIEKAEGSSAPGSPLDQVSISQTQSPSEARPDTTLTACANHPDEPPHYLCRMCGAALCAECPRMVSGTPICPLCGDLCRPYHQIKAHAVRLEFQSSGFGIDDFKRAVAYPFQHKIALVTGALLYGLLLLAGFRGSLIAWMIMFGCISHVISQVAWGRTNRSFMPDFSAFSLWDDLVVPIFLGLGIMIVTWGPVICLALALVFGVIGTQGIKQAALPIADSSSSGAPSREDLSALMDPNADPKKLEEASKKLDQLRPGAPLAQEAERTKRQQSDPTANVKMLMPYVSASMIFLPLILLGLAWAIFYYPMALTVAGFTQSFGSVVNPLVGLDTIRRMGSTYFKAFGMVLLVQVVALFVGGMVAYVTAPLALPFFGNLPANFINGTITFYFNLVIACLLGLSLFKCADRLGITVD